MIIKLNNKFYKKEAVKEALDNFKGVCRGNIIDDSIKIELESKKDIQNLSWEFCNYVLGLMKNKSLV